MKEPSFQIIDRITIGREKWDSFIQNSDEAWLWHRYDYQDANATWSKVESLSFAVVDTMSGDEILAIVPIFLEKNKYIKIFYGNVLTSIGWVAYADRLNLTQRKNISIFLLDYIKKTSRKYFAGELNVLLTPVAPAYHGLRCPLVNPLLNFGFENTLGQTWIVDLQKTHEQLWEGLERRPRRAVIKAEQSGVVIREGTINDLDLFYNLHLETYLRTGKSPINKAYFEIIWNKFLSNNLTFILIAEREGRPLAAANFGVFKQSAHYWTAGANEEGLKAQAYSLIQWTAIQKLKEQNCLYYETGEAVFETSKKKSKLISDFKKSFGGDLYPYYKGRLYLNKRKNLLNNVYKTIQEL